MRTPGRWVWIALGSLLFCGVLLFRLGETQRQLLARAYSIGWEVNPPDQLRDANGEPSGFAVELVREAARRRGIHLNWVYRPESSEAALRSHAVDLWPLITITPERTRALHISAPYLQSTHCLLVRGESSASQMGDLADKRIGFTGLPFDISYFSRRLPRAERVIEPQQQLLPSLCAGEVDAIFTEAHVTLTNLLNGGGCPGQPLKVILTEDRTQLGVGSTFESAAAADAIRDEIGQMAIERLLPPLMAKWGFLPGRSEDAVAELLATRGRERWLAVLAIVFALLVLFAAWLAYRANRERRKAMRSELELRESERRFRGLLENVRMSAFMADLEGRFTFCNDWFLATTGWAREELLGRPITDLLAPEDRLRVSRMLESISDVAPHDWTSEAGVLTKGGKVHWFQSNVLVLRDSQGKPVGFANLSVDVTEHRALQEQYLQAQKMEGLGRMAGGVAHDFNNLLTVIGGYSEMVYRKLKDGDPLRSRVDQVRKAAARASDLTQQLLAFSRKQVVQPRPLDLNQVVVESGEMWKRLLGERIQLETRLSPGLGQVMADAGQMHQVVMNLVVNGRDAMPDGGRLVIETSEVDVDSGWLAEDSEAIAGPYIALAVSDNGIGMDESTRKRIFEPFFTTKPQGEGTGLGLSTVYGIVKQSGGWVRVFSEPGEGTMFRVYLPRIQPQRGTGNDISAARQGTLGSETLLLVEDQEEVRHFTTQVLAECGYRVLGAASANEALDLVANRTDRIDALLTDVVLPGMNGFELAKRLATIRPGLRVLFTSGYTGESATLRGILESGREYLPKPYAPDQVAARIRAVLDSPAPSW